MQVYSFAKIEDLDARMMVYDEIKKGKSRFGMWDQIKSLHEEWYGKHSCLLRIKKGDWIVHVNSPRYGQCIAVKVLDNYGFDEGLECSWGKDFKNYIPVDPDTIVEFDRKNPNILPTVNLAPRRRCQRIPKTEDFLTSLENIKKGTFNDVLSPDRNSVHLRNKVSDILPQITHQIHLMNKSKDFEVFLHKIFDSMPNTISIQNGFGWGTDYGADLIVEFENPIIGINITNKLVVQAKSYEGKHFDTKAVDQIAQGIEKYDADAGLLITTAEETEEIESYIAEVSDNINKTIDLMAGADVARFVLRYDPESIL